MITSDPYGISHATRPGRQEAAGGRRRPIQSYDTPAQIHRCQSCKRPECTNCLTVPTVSLRAARRAEFTRLYDQGRTDSEIAAAMGVTQQTVYYYRRKFGLEPNRRKTDPCTGCYNRGLCAARGLACGAKLRYEEARR